MSTVRWESGAELLAGPRVPLSDYDRDVIRRLRAAVDEGRTLLLSPVGVVTVHAQGAGRPDECLAATDWAPGNPDAMLSQVRRWEREAGVVVQGLASEFLHSREGGENG